VSFELFLALSRSFLDHDNLVFYSFLVLYVQVELLKECEPLLMARSTIFPLIA
jgi:hypothetical protein